MHDSTQTDKQTDKQTGRQTGYIMPAHCPSHSSRCRQIVGPFTTFKASDRLMDSKLKCPIDLSQKVMCHRHLTHTTFVFVEKRCPPYTKVVYETPSVNVTEKVSMGYFMGVFVLNIKFHIHVKKIPRSLYQGFNVPDSCL